MNYPAISGKLHKRTVMQKKIEKGIYQEGKYSFRVRMMLHGDKIDKTFDDLPSAQAFRDGHRLSQALDVHESAVFKSRIQKRSIKGKTVDDMLDRYLKEITPAKKGAKDEKCRIGKARRMALAKKPFVGVTPDDVLAFLDEIGSSDNNKRKYASLISHLYTVAARKWRLPVENPVSGKIDLPSNGTPRERRLRGNEYRDFHKALSGEALLFFIVAIETAMRKSEIFILQWELINWKAHSGLLTDTKNGTQRTTYFSGVAMAALKKIKKTKGKVFSITESQLRDQWEAARAEVGSPDLHFHDLRHEGTSRLFEKGLNILEVQAITGHKTLEELKKYTHLSPNLIVQKLG
jgi:integrase